MNKFKNNLDEKANNQKKSLRLILGIVSGLVLILSVGATLWAMFCGG